MTQEEKAKAYDEAYKVAKDIHRFSSDLADIKRMEQIFPELAESEDEKIKNWIVAKLTQTCRNATGEEDKDVVEKYHKACAWLEKQSEQKLVDKDEPKFKVGDWITIK